MTKLQLFSRVIIIVSLGWIVWMIYPELSSLPSYTSSINYEFIPITLGIGIFSHFFYIYGFRALLEAHQKISISLFTTARFWSGSQIARYLPGRIFGIAYQISLAENKMSKLAIIHANISFMYIDTLTAISIATAILLSYYDHIFLGVLIILISFICSLYIAPERLLNIIITYTLKFFPSLRDKINIQNMSKPITNKIAISKVFLANLVGLAFNLISWWSLVKVFPTLPEDKMILLWACYMLAWAVGFVILIVPAGIGVRENAFIFLGKLFVTAPILVVLSIIARIWYILLDVLLYLFVYILYSISKKEDSS